MKTFFVYFPFFILFLNYCFFVKPLTASKWLRLPLLLLLGVCASKFLVFREFYGDAFAPVAPEHVLWAWNWAYSGFVILLPLAVLARIFFIPRGALLLLPLAAWGISARGLYNGIRPPEVVEHNLEYASLPEDLHGYTIVQLSDLHACSAATRWRTEAIVEKVNSLNADLVVVTGDIVDGTPEDQSENVEPLRNLKARDGVYFITGNHEFYHEFFACWKPLYDSWGFHFVDDRCVIVRPSLALAGRYDMIGAQRYHLPSAPAHALFVNVSEDAFRILLDHQPRRFLGNLRESKADLQLSGHTHGGVMPILRQLVRWWNGGFYRGLYTLDGKKLFVSPGAGQWAGFPMRFDNDAEISVLRLIKR